MSEETLAFTANIYINGKKVGYCKNTGQGGWTDYNADYDVSTKSVRDTNRKAIAEAEAYCKALPKVRSGEMQWEQSFEGYINQLLENWLKTNEEKKMIKKMQTCILVGSLDKKRLSYSYYNFKRSLSDFTAKQLQDSVERIKANLKQGEKILNTNLEAMGITI